MDVLEHQVRLQRLYFQHLKSRPRYWFKHYVKIQPVTRLLLLVIFQILP